MLEFWIDLANEFTRVYKQNISVHPALREQRCLSVLLPRMLKPLKETDILAGHDGHLTLLTWPVMIHPRRENQTGYNIKLPTIEALRAEFPSRSKELDGLTEFWKGETTYLKIISSAPPSLKKYYFCAGRVELAPDGYTRRLKPDLPKGAGYISGCGDTRMAGTVPDYGELMRLGLVGLKQKVETAYAANPEHGEFYEACFIALETVQNTLAYYKTQAQTLLKTAKSENISNLTRLANALEALETRPPRTLFEGAQLMNIFRILTMTDNYGRMDTYFAPLYKSDIQNGSSFEDEVEVLRALWSIIDETDSPYDTRLYIGGMGRENEKDCDEFCLAAMEATRLNHAVRPVVSLRWYKAQNPLLMRKAVECISEGCIYPVLYNDEVFVKGCMGCMNLPYEQAIHYAPLGCGETVLENNSSGSPNSTIRVLKALEAALHNGRDAADGAVIGEATGECEALDSYEKLEYALYTQLDAALEKDIHAHMHNRSATAKECAYVFSALLMEDCVGRGLGLPEGGLKYFGANIEGFGVTNTANSLAAIKKFVYDEQKFTLRQLVQILDKNFEGEEDVQRLLAAAPKFGNNDPFVDDIKVRLENFINDTAARVGREHGLDWYTVANVNPGGITIGPEICASADGRACADTMAVGNSAVPGTDTKGLTTLLISAAKTGPESGGTVTNINLSRETVTKDPEKFRLLIEAGFNMGQHQLNINCFSRGDLEQALKHPEKYSNLIVRVSGYSARFIYLVPITQKHIMERTLF